MKFESIHIIAELTQYVVRKSSVICIAAHKWEGKGGEIKTHTGLLRTSQFVLTLSPPILTCFGSDPVRKRLPFLIIFSEIKRYFKKNYKR
jgi:hypothetical protein